MPIMVTTRPPPTLALWMQDVLERLKENDPDITELNQRSRDMDDVTAIALASALQHNTVLKKLVLSINGIGPVGARALAAKLRKQTRIEILELWNNRIGDAGAKAVGGMLRSNKHLVSLHLAKNGIGHVGAKALTDGLKRNKTLLKLWLGRNRIGDKGAVSFGSMLKTNQHLVFLNLFGNSIGPEGAAGLAEGLKHNSSVESLYLGYDEVGDEGAAAFGKMLRFNRTLKVLHLWGNSIGDDGLASLAEDGISYNDCLEELGLEGIFLGNKGTKALGRALRINKRLKTLLLAGNSWQDTDGNAVDNIATGLHHNCTLKKLRLVENTGGDESCIALGKMLRINRGLEYLSLRKLNRTSRTCGIELMKGLERNCSLVNLVVYGITFDDGCTKSIETMLKKNQTLKGLHLDSSIQDMNHIEAGLRDNYYLEMLVLENQIKTEKMRFYLDLNKAGRRLLRQSHVPAALWPHVLAKHKHDPSLLYYFCCAKPDLFLQS